MTLWKKKLEPIGIHTESFLIPKPDIDLSRWAVVACDQYTSEPEYWNGVDAFVGNHPSALRLIFPEVWLERETEEEQHARIEAINAAMRGYLGADLFQTVDGPILVERLTQSGECRLGVMVAVDLECYDYTSGSQSPIRATEGTIVDRLPPRIRIRKDAMLETPHIMILIDDPQRTVIEPLLASTRGDENAGARLLYDFSLMERSGRLRGWQMTDPDTLTRFAAALADLADPLQFRNRYHAGEEKGPLPFAVGDGNHSLATAKACWEQIKAPLSESERVDHPARYALVELVNVHDQGLLFEPIHRVIFGADREQFVRDWKAWSKEKGLNVHMEGAGSEMGTDHMVHTVLLISPEGTTRMVWENPLQQLAVGSLQTFLDSWMDSHLEATLDYVHGEEVTRRLGSASGNLGFLLPVMSKESLFPTVIRDGALPRKTFSMGEAHEKRFYLECRKIR